MPNHCSNRVEIYSDNTSLLDEIKKNLKGEDTEFDFNKICLLYTSPSPRDHTRSRMPSSA